MKKKTLTLFIYILLFALIFIGINQYKSISESIEADRKMKIKKAIIDASIQCYVIEGAYPKSLDYLKNNYGLSINDKRYIIDYQCIASNQLPEVKVLSK